MKIYRLRLFLNKFLKKINATLPNTIKRKQFKKSGVTTQNFRRVLNGFLWRHFQSSYYSLHQITLRILMEQ